MSLRTVIRWFFALFFAVLCYYASASWVKGQGFTAALHYHASSAPDFAAYDAWQRYLLDNPSPEIIASAVWARGGTGSLSTEAKQTTVDVYHAKGNANLILPVHMLAGTLPMEDEYSIALDDVSAFALFGSVQVVGLTLQYSGQTYNIVGVFQAPQGIFSWGNSTGRGMAFLVPPAASPVQSLGLLLEPSPEETSTRASNLGGYMGSPGYVENRDLTAGFVRQFGLLPLWIWAISSFIPLIRGLWKYVKRGAKYDPLVSSLPQRTFDIFLRALAIAISAAACYGLLRLTDFSPNLPTSWLPTRWSDFSHWPNLLVKLGEQWATARELPVLRPELMRWTLFGISLLACTLATVLCPHQPKEEFPAFLIMAALLPALAIALVWYLQADIFFAPVLVFLPAACVCMRWLGAFFAERSIMESGEKGGESD